MFATRGHARSTRGQRPRPLLEGLEHRPLRSVAMLDLGAMDPARPSAEAVAGAPSDAPSITKAGQGRVSMAFPWRIIADDAVEPAPASATLRVVEEQLPRVGDFGVRVVPDVPLLSVRGSVSAVETIDLFRVDLSPGFRDLRIRYQTRGEAETPSPPIRVWLLNARGEPIDARWFIESGGIDLRMHARGPIGPTTVYVGIELDRPTFSTPQSQDDGPPAATQPADSGPIHYHLAIDRRRDPAFLGDSPLSSGEAPIATSGDLGDEPSAPEAPETFALPTSFSTDRPALSASSGAIAPASVSATPIGGAALRPLPTQGAATVGGLLPAGPAIRGVPLTFAVAGGNADESAATTPMDTRVAATASEAGDAANAEDSDAVDAAIRAIWGDPPPPGVGDVPDRPRRIGEGLMAVRGLGGAPLLGATMRVASRFPEQRRSSPDPTKIAEAAVVPDRRPVAVEGSEASTSSPEVIETPPARSSDGPTRPRVLRSALFGAAALAFGLILPDLAADRPSMRHRGWLGRRPWRFDRPRIA